MKPFIGITCHNDLDYLHMLNNAYIQSILDAGGTPVLLPLGEETDTGSVADRLDGLLLSGGFDVDPHFYGEEPHKDLGEISPGRDTYELSLLQAFLQMDKPVLGICRGHQVLNVAQGGTLYQDIYDQIDGPVQQHAQRARREHLSHKVSVAEGSRLADIFGTDTIQVNSFHHQGVKSPGDSLEVTGTADDGVIEAIESKDHTFVIGVQWHPENTACAGDIHSKKLFSAFVGACGKS
ncbi:gamma-glutamyl-gamma-aminobutyrate hydrolase [Sporosarcina sp. NCCP-2716]|uniref:gamma-glutamyl-gamma-aminobutyrate hydrolase family protein n=1 Tax=Sporosarcina sp. NCCP-2716 TaxID=2943679 RepID=UPI00203B23B1|nr:gamma-glutamyl-gamma-aminobutyrate hydrolase family protein [Sporosarcina sp. NCCP-2716]GKV69334.1 gamma-glutamyl-gamma-aminobutyrate hydrolase [Sporosarcina sp. NCCP-2716]